MTHKTPALIVINQTINLAFMEWLNSLSDEVGTIELWTGNPLEFDIPNVIVRKAPGYDKSSVISRLWTWSIFTVIVGWCLLIRRKKAPLFVVTNPPLMPLMAGLLHVLRGYSFGLLEWDIYPQVADVMSLLSRRHPVYRLWYWWHGKVLQKASTIITLSEAMAYELEQMISNHHLDIKVIPNWVYTGWIKPLERARNPFAIEQNLTDELVVLYSGNMGATHSIETIIAVAERLSHLENIVFIMIGDGAKKSLISDAIEEGRVPNVRLLPYQSSMQLPRSLAVADIGIVTLASGYEHLSMPSKTYNLMAAGNALLGISNTPNGLEDIIEQFDCGANFAPDDHKMIADWVVKMAKDREFLREYQQNAREAAEIRFSAEKCKSRMTQVLKQELI